MAVENMAAAKGVSSAAEAERCDEGHGEDSWVDVYSKSKSEVCVRVRNAAAI